MCTNDTPLRTQKISSPAALIKAKPSFSPTVTMSLGTSPDEGDPFFGIYKRYPPRKYPNLYFVQLEDFKPQRMVTSWASNRSHGTASKLRWGTCIRTSFEFGRRSPTTPPKGRLGVLSVLGFWR
jgi:hypothetical protein